MAKHKTNGRNDNPYVHITTPTSASDKRSKDKVLEMLGRCGKKVRMGDKRIVRIKEKVLVAHGVAKISAYVTHGIFPKSDLAEGLSYFWITDSCGLTVK
ncbi:unnamed protein product [Arabis nemorensis]|uniref:Uncharacterized protein n=1 Tax=Arabis nemorensis TaxID=586526 RepID=A0A565AXB7_9BRAS|nr:unnamed protein product [Arabis nemorensis]